MKFSRFLNYLFKVFIISLIINSTLSLQKKNDNNKTRNNDCDSELEVVSHRDTGSQKIVEEFESEPSSKNPVRIKRQSNGQRPRNPPGQSKRKKNNNRNNDDDYESEGVSRRDGVEEFEREPVTKRPRGQPERRARNLPPGQAKKRNRDRVYEETTVYYEDVRPPGRSQSGNNGNGNRNKNKNKPKPNRGNTQSNNNNNNNNRDNDYDDSRPQTPRPKPPQTTRRTTTTEAPVTLEYLPSSEWRSLERLRHHWQNTAHTKSALAKKFIFFMERDSDYQRHDACLTPDQKLGSCHYVQHCPIPDVIRSFDKFLSYACFIHNRYVGICCPDDYFDLEETQVKPQKVTMTTKRPAQSQSQPSQQNPSRRPQNDNNGSDYNNGICGVSENTRIIGGALADPKDWLWMAALILQRDTKPFCGGTVITNQHILTAAHCLTDLTPDRILIRLGGYDFSAAADPEAQDFSVDYFKIHPKYNRITNENDLAIIKLRTKTPFTESIKPVCLPQRNRNYAGQLAIVTGWGHTSFGGKGSAQLRQVSLPVWNNTNCETSYSINISDNMLCAGNPSGGKDSCQGDSGGPLMLQGPNNRWMIIGVVSWGVKCGQPGFPGVYTRISKYIDWVKVNSKEGYK